MIMYDIESLGVESTSVILSAAAIHFTLSEFLGPPEIFDDLLSRAVFVKFNVEEQIVRYKRTVDKGTVEWWKKQASIPRKLSVVPSPDDLSVVDGFKIIKDYIKSTGNEGSLIWARGSLDQVATDSLTNAAGLEPLAPYNKWRDVRTAIDLTKDKADDGYCPIPGFNPAAKVIKHDPRQDCALDIVMMLFGE